MRSLARTQVSCCYCWDEAIDGALFDASRELVVVWARREAEIVFYILQARDGLTSAGFLRRFRVRCEASEELQRVAWAGHSVMIWVGNQVRGRMHHQPWQAARPFSLADGRRRLSMASCRRPTNDHVCRLLMPSNGASAPTGTRRCWVWLLTAGCGC